MKYKVDSLVAPGTTVPYAQRGKWLSTDEELGEIVANSAEDDDDRIDIPLDTKCMEIEPEEFPAKQEAFYDRLRLLRKHGLKAAAMLKMTEVWSQGAGVHILRAAPVSENWAKKIDDSTGRMVAELLTNSELFSETQRIQCFVPRKCGVWGLAACSRGDARLGWVRGREDSHRLHAYLAFTA